MDMKHTPTPLPPLLELEPPKGESISKGEADEPFKNRRQHTV